MNNGHDNSGQHPVLKSDLTKMGRKLTLENVAQAAVILAAIWAAYTFGFAALVGPAVAESPKVQQLDSRVTALEGGQSELRSLAIRQLEEQRAVGTWIATGYRAPILDAPLPPKDGGP